jgi:AcrR family transcriptional regulator
MDLRTRRERRKEALRGEIIAAAHQLVQEEGYDGLTIRKLAKRIGYAPMSVYSYFADKQDILYALAEDAFELLAKRIEQRTSSDPLEALRAVMTEYAAFGLGNPHEYRIVFMTEKAELPSGQNPGEPEERNPAMQLLVGRVEACVAAGLFSGDPRAIATMLWAIGHGGISLLITFPNYAFGDQQAFVKRMCDFAIAGLSKMDVAPLTDGTPAGC